MLPLNLWQEYRRTQNKKTFIELNSDYLLYQYKCILPNLTMRRKARLHVLEPIRLVSCNDGGLGGLVIWIMSRRSVNPNTRTCGQMFICQQKQREEEESCEVVRSTDREKRKVETLQQLWTKQGGKTQDLVGCKKLKVAVLVGLGGSNTLQQVGVISWIIIQGWRCRINELPTPNLTEYW